MAVVCILAVHLKAPVANKCFNVRKQCSIHQRRFPRPYEPRSADGRIETHQVELPLTTLLDNDDGHRAIRRARGPQPHITHPRDLRAVTPGPLAPMLQILPLDLAPVCPA